MDRSSTIIIELILSLPISLYLYGFVSQIYQNYHQRNSVSAQSLMTITLLLYGLSAKSLYFNLIELPVVYRIGASLCAFCIMIMLAQNYYYRSSMFDKYAIRAIFLILFSASFTIAWLISFFPGKIIGYYLGWFGTSCLFFATLPQLIHNYQRQTTAGLHPGYILSGIVAVTIELVMCLFLRWPLPTLANTLRALLYELVLVKQFLFYRYKK